MLQGSCQYKRVSEPRHGNEGHTSAGFRCLPSGFRSRWGTVLYSATLNDPVSLDMSENADPVWRPPGHTLCIRPRPAVVISSMSRISAVTLLRQETKTLDPFSRKERSFLGMCTGQAERACGTWNVIGDSPTLKSQIPWPKSLRNKPVLSQDHSGYKGDLGSYPAVQT